MTSPTSLPACACRAHSPAPSGNGVAACACRAPSPAPSGNGVAACGCGQPAVSACDTPRPARPPRIGTHKSAVTFLETRTPNTASSQSAVKLRNYQNQSRSAAASRRHSKDQARGRSVGRLLACLTDRASACKLVSVSSVSEGGSIIALVYLE